MVDSFFLYTFALTKSENINMSQIKDLAYWKANAEEDYLHVPISVLRYISELEKLQEKNNRIREEVKNPRNPEVEGDMS